MGIWNHCYVLSPHAVYGWIDGANFVGNEANAPYILSVGFIKGSENASSVVLSYGVAVTERSAGKKTHLKFMCE